MKKKSVLRGIIAELLKEEDLIADPDLEGEDSLDAQVDRYFSDFEAEASNSKNEAFDFRMLTRRFLLEVGEDEEEGAEEEPEGEEGEEGAEGGDEEAEEEPDLLKAEDIASALEDFKNELLESFGAEIGKSDKDMEDDLDVPSAARASGSVEGGG